MKLMKKMMALVLAVVMTLTLSAAFATSADDTYKGSGDSNAINTGEGARVGTAAIPLTKGIVFFNANNSNVYEPNVTFNYAVASDTAINANGTTATVTDGSSPAVQRNVYPGPANGVSGTTISFSSSNDAVTTSFAGTEIEHTGNLTVTLSEFERPGIYRYVITESVTAPSTGSTDSEKLQAAGLTARDANYKNTRYLDVYIRNGASGLEMYGAVIFVSTATTAGTDSITTNTEKTTGFEPRVGGASSYASDTNVDKYTTYDFSVKKTVDGTMADKTHEFPFYVSVSNSINGARFTYTADGTETFTGATNSSGAVTLSAAAFQLGSDSKESTLKLKHNDSIKLVGVPSAQGTDKLSVVVKEFNDTYDQYTATVAATSTTDPTISKTNGSDGAGGVMNATSGSIETASFAILANDIANQILTVTNTLSEISPTGVVLRIAPYALMLAAGIVLLVLAMKRRSNKEEEA